MAMVMPRVSASPARADSPDSAVIRPILMGSAASAGCRARPAVKRAAAVARSRKERRVGTIETLLKKVERILHGVKGCFPTPCKIHATCVHRIADCQDRAATRGDVASLGVVCMRQNRVLFPKNEEFC
ncbi:hypothetical protein D3C73_1073530 [compost metagenome]